MLRKLIPEDWTSRILSLVVVALLIALIPITMRDMRIRKEQRANALAAINDGKAYDALWIRLCSTERQTIETENYVYGFAYEPTNPNARIAVYPRDDSKYVFELQRIGVLSQNADGVWSFYGDQGVTESVFDEFHEEVMTWIGLPLSPRAQRGVFLC